MGKKRDHHRYELKDGAKIVYIGITKRPPGRRQEEHRGERKRFTHMHLAGPTVTKETAEQWEEGRLAAYRRSHGGKNPKYNKTSK